MTTKIREHHVGQKTGLAAISVLAAAAAKPVAERPEGGRRRKGVDEQPEKQGEYRLVMACHVEQGAFNQ